MTYRKTAFTLAACALTVGFWAAAATIGEAQQEATPTSLLLVNGRVSIAGTSNIHPFIASTTAIRIVRVKLAAGAAGSRLADDVLKPGAIEAFEIAISARSLTSPKEGIDKNMHKALNVTAHHDITFRLIRLDNAGAAGALRAVGVLGIAGVEREVTLTLKTSGDESTVTVTGELPLLMTDFGIAPPKAMLGMLKTDPKVTVTFETVLAR
jgi:hypothetical protein